MTNANYRRGYGLEYRAKKLMESKGWMVTRLPASKSPADLMAFNTSSKILVQCKKTSKDALYIYGLGDVIRLASEHGARPVLVYGFRRTGAYAMDLAEENVILKRDGLHTSLDRYLEGIK